MPVDCNNCIYLSITEVEQNHIRKVLKKTIDHTCTKYNKRVFHNHKGMLGRNHSSYLYPCTECIEKPEYMEVE